MAPFTVLDGVAAPLDQSKVDTDQILPARFLRRPRKEGYGQFLFRDWMDDPKFVLNQPAYRQAKILVADRNFGGGSSREQAPWALSDYGIRCVIAADFGDIFYLNSLKTGLLPIALPAEKCDFIRRKLHETPGATMKVDLPAQTVTGPDGKTYRFEIDAFRKKCLVEGLDDIGVTLQHEAAIAAFETKYRQRFDWLFP
ncbi:MAG TPA: 3-isopropylmalate dehydratase small subunit [Burkholderiaceae bacterium]|nr:3-isopropylmalate dehydratase small subunit [Burkholderiaceae bacterium]